ncbi:SEC-C metal-binding domain-containing protein [Paenibacillus sacheonensis]|uniref:SEC-C motif-containing protein n=1 Tax=Paenibacillus sacheonensis TaxID=742054 RepID=A0A7X5BZX5_9BACL|nr:SEC-C metal-binding domain-containing protein [Paenibacillus sacheonensis]MBM7567090.1 hypothetical protein [Paenibacillus sacheonensis]NBC70981.1 hypothetical protein [Paenibacillus sacheonensis]
MTKKAKVGRNAPCPCGSGMKYKKCCLPQDEAARMANVSVLTAAGAETRTEADLYGAVPETIEDMYGAIERMSWSNSQYGIMARTLVQHLSERFTWDEINATILLWFAYSREQEPVVPKPGVVFAALEYSLAQLTGRSEVTKAEVAKRYEVSAGSVSKRIADLSPFVERAIAALNGE